ncbi:hypothetical protein GEMRC1_006728 [Eukaryota sp. GEM-RC1]
MYSKLISPAIPYLSDKQASFLSIMILSRLSLTSPLYSFLLSLLSTVASCNCPPFLAHVLSRSVTANVTGLSPCFHPSLARDSELITSLQNFKFDDCDLVSNLIQSVASHRVKSRHNDFLKDSCCLSLFSSSQISIEFPFFGPISFPSSKGWTYTVLMNFKYFDSIEQNSNFMLSILNLSSNNDKLLLDLSLSVSESNPNQIKLNLTYGQSILRRAHKPSSLAQSTFPKDGFSVTFSSESFLDAWTCLSFPTPLTTLFKYSTIPIFFRPSPFPYPSIHSSFTRTTVRAKLDSDVSHLDLTTTVASNWVIQLHSAAFFSNPLPLHLLHVLCTSHPMVAAHGLSTTSDVVSAALHPRLVKDGLVHCTTEDKLRHFLNDQQFLFVGDEAPQFLIDFSSKGNSVNFVIPSYDLMTSPFTSAPKRVQYSYGDSLPNEIFLPLKSDLICWIHDLSLFEIFVSSLKTYPKDSLQRLSVIQTIFAMVDVSFPILNEFTSRHLYFFVMSCLRCPSPNESEILTILKSCLFSPRVCDCSSQCYLITDERALSSIIEWELWRSASPDSKHVFENQSLEVLLDYLSRCCVVPLRQVDGIFKKRVLKSPSERTPKSPFALDSLSPALLTPTTSPSLSAVSSRSSLHVGEINSPDSSEVDFLPNTTHSWVYPCSCCYEISNFNKTRLFSVGVLDFLLKLCFSSRPVSNGVIINTIKLADVLPYCTCQSSTSSITSCVLCDYVYSQESYSDLLGSLRDYVKDSISSKYSREKSSTDDADSLTSIDQQFHGQFAEVITLSLYFRAALSNRNSTLNDYTAIFSKGRTTPSPLFSPQEAISPSVFEGKTVDTSEANNDQGDSDDDDDDDVILTITDVDGDLGDSQSRLGKALLDLIVRHLSKSPHLLKLFVVLHPIEVIISLMPDSNLLFPGLLELFKICVSTVRKSNIESVYDYLYEVLSEFSCLPEYLLNVLSLFINNSSGEFTVDAHCFSSVCVVLNNTISKLQPKFSNFSSNLIPIISTIRQLTHSWSRALQHHKTLYFTLIGAAHSLTSVQVKPPKAINGNNEMAKFLQAGFVGLGSKSGFSDLIRGFNVLFSFCESGETDSHSNHVMDELKEAVDSFFDMLVDCVMTCDFPEVVLSVTNVNLGDVASILKILQMMGIVEYHQSIHFSLFLNTLTSIDGVCRNIRFEYLLFKKCLSIFSDAVSTNVSTRITTLAIRDLLLLFSEIYPRILKWNPSSFSPLMSFTKRKAMTLTEPHSDSCIFSSNYSAITSTNNLFVEDITVNNLVKDICKNYGNVLLALLSFTSSSVECTASFHPLLKVFLNPSTPDKQGFLEQILQANISNLFAVLYKVSSLLLLSLDSTIMHDLHVMFYNLIHFVMGSSTLKKQLSPQQKSQLSKFSKSLRIDQKSPSTLPPSLTEAGKRGSLSWVTEVQLFVAELESTKYQALCLQNDSSVDMSTGKI